MRWLLAIALVGCAGTVDDGTGTELPDPMEKAVDIEGPDVLPHVQKFANLVCGTFDACTISTYVGHSPTASRAIDILVSDIYGKVPTDDNVLGDAVAAFVLEQQDANAITYVIWRQRYNDGSGWDPMEDRGSITQNHYDHVHVSFEAMP
jgi:hypothetical protein